MRRGGGACPLPTAKALLAPEQKLQLAPALSIVPCAHVVRGDVAHRCDDGGRVAAHHVCRGVRERGRSVAGRVSAVGRVAWWDGGSKGARGVRGESEGDAREKEREGEGEKER